MKQKWITRREFIRQGTGAAGALIISGAIAGCTSLIRGKESARSEKRSAPGGRRHYKTFSEGVMGSMRLKNRLVRSATMISAASSGKPTDKYISMHKDLAEGGIGMIITGFMIPTEEDARYSRQIFIYDNEHIPGLRRVADEIHRAESTCRIVAQIGHSGETVSPSGIRWPFPWKRQGRALSTKEVEGIVTDFAEAIRRVKESGFDGVELHGAHAYLLSSFLSPVTNRRKDKYGGSLEKRVHIIREIMDQARRLVGSDFPILIKLNSDDNIEGGIKPDNFPALAREIVKTGINAIDVSGNDCLKTGISSIEEETYFLKGAEVLDVKVPIIVTGGNRTIEHLESIIQKGEVDFFGLARPLIREPDLPYRWLEGRGGDRCRCIDCNGCFGVIMRGETTYCVQEV
jgi:2,4-dienoyl-CoA reductase-like NADH-dependent reductase (Old Yellow Enzyme family)